MSYYCCNLCESLFNDRETKVATKDLPKGRFSVYAVNFRCKECTDWYNDDFSQRSYVKPMIEKYSWKVSGKIRDLPDFKSEDMKQITIPEEKKKELAKEHMKNIKKMFLTGTDLEEQESIPAVSLVSGAYSDPKQRCFACLRFVTAWISSDPDHKPYPWIYCDNRECPQFHIDTETGFHFHRERYLDRSYCDECTYLIEIKKVIHFEEIERWID